MFELAHPWVFLLLPLPWLAWLLAPPQSSPLSVAMIVPFFKAVTTMVRHEKYPTARSWGLYGLYLIWCLIVLALAGPRWVGEPQPLSQDGYNIMLALDLSGSMDLSDMILNGQPATRLAVVKKAALQFVKDRPGDKIGLILFGSRAYLQTPLTHDHQSVVTRIDDATAGLAGKTTSIGDALGLAVKRLQQVPTKGRLIILLTDGVNNSGVLAPLKAAELARAEDIKVYTIGLGAEVDPQAMPGFFFDINAGADLDEGTLKEMATMTGGRYFRATDMSSLAAIYKTINQMEAVSEEAAVVRPQHDYYPWPLALALLLSFYWLLSRHGLLSSFRAAFYRGRPE